MPLPKASTRLPSSPHPANDIHLLTYRSVQRQQSGHVMLPTYTTLPQV